MKKSPTGQLAVFLNVIKWLLLASAVGSIVGLSTAAFLKALGWVTTLTHGFSYYFLMLPAALFASEALARALAPEAAGGGTDRVIKAVNRRSGKVAPLVAPVKFVASIITIAAGGSAGKEGPCAQIGAGLASVTSSLLKFDDKDRKKLVICGISAGFSAVFGTPIAGAIFGLEVLFAGGLLYEVLLPSFLAGIISYHVSSYLGVVYFNEPLRFSPVISGGGLFFLKVCLSGVFFGFCSFLFINVSRGIEKVVHLAGLRISLKAALGGLVLVLLSFAFSTKYLGLGLDPLERALEGMPAPYISFLAKMLFTAVTLGFGGSGGNITPIFFIGATAGSTFGSMLGMDLSFSAAIGMVSLLAGCADTPVSASIMALELFGPRVAPYAAIACVLSFVLSGPRSIYPSQISKIEKSSF